MKSGKRVYLSIILMVLVLSLSGCVKQSVIVNSEPSGARIYFDGEDKGTTPADFPFKWYGGHRIHLEKEGYKPLVETVELSSPAHLKVPVDFFTEVIPYNFKDRHELNYTLTPEAPE